jgi:hypothetical protein
VLYLKKIVLKNLWHVFFLAPWISQEYRYQLLPIYEKVVTYYENLKGIPAPYSKRVTNTPSYFPEGNMSDHIGYGALLNRLP